MRTSTLLAILLCTVATSAQVPIPDYPDIEYARVGDSTSLKLDIYMPAIDVDGPAPAVVYIHGGGWRAGDRKVKRILFPMEREYVVISIDYRLTTEAIFPAQIHDCKGAIRWVRAHAAEYGIDPERIGVLGTSAGAHLASLVGTSGDVAELEGEVGGNLEYSSRVQAVCSWFGLGNIATLPRYPSSQKFDVLTSPISMLLGGLLEDRLDLARLASPATWISPDDPPFLLQHGTDDMTVPFGASVEFDSALRSGGVEVEFQPVVGAAHGGPAFESDSVRGKGIEFFERHLLGASGIEEGYRESPDSLDLSHTIPTHNAGTSRYRSLTLTNASLIALIARQGFYPCQKEFYPCRMGLAGWTVRASG